MTTTNSIRNDNSIVTELRVVRIHGLRTSASWCIDNVLGKNNGYIDTGDKSSFIDIG